MSISQTSLEIISLIVTLFLAFTGYFISYLNNLRISRRKERLELINSQINKLYGPLYIITRTNSETFHAYLKKQQKDYIDTNNPEWREYVNTIIIPQNEKLAQIIIANAHLIIDEEMPRFLSFFIAHHASYKMLSKKWAQGDFSETEPFVEFPDDIYDYAEKSFIKLRKEQLKIIGAIE